MNTRKKIYKLFSIILFFVFAIIGSQSGYGNNDTALPETVIKITGDENNDPVSLTFIKPGQQEIIIENRSQRDIRMVDIFFIGDDFTTPLVTHGITVLGYNSEHDDIIIKPQTSYSFVIKASDKASPTINPDGDLLVLAYYQYDKKIPILIPLKVKIDYNNSVEFLQRNLEFFWHKNEYSLKLTQALTIVNHNLENSIQITDIKVARDSHANFIIKNNFKYILTPGRSCIVDIAVNANDIIGINDVKPIWITYNVIDKDNTVVSADLTAVAAIIIKESVDKNGVEPIKAIYNGGAFAVSVIGAGGARTKIFGKNWLSSTIEGFIAGGFYKLVGGINYNTDHGYDSKNWGNKAIEVLSLNSILGGYYCPKEHGPLYASCVAATIICGEFSIFGTETVMDHLLLANTVSRLPEHQQWPITSYLSIAAYFRNSCQTMLGVFNTGLDGIYQDGVSGMVMDGWSSLTKKSELNKLSLPVNSSRTPLMHRPCSTCVCSYSNLKLDSTIEVHDEQ